MSEVVTTAKLRKKHKDLVFQRLAEFWTATEIQEELKQLYDIEIAFQTVGYYRKKYKSKILELRREWLDEIENDIPISNKKIRLMEYQRALNRVKDGYKETVVTPQGEKIIVDKYDVYGIIRILQAVAKEMEPFDREKAKLNEQNYVNTGSGSVNVYNLTPEQAERMSDDELREVESKLESELEGLGFSLVPTDRFKLNDN
jgi:hypothetical protein